MKIRTKLLLSYLLIVGLFVAAGATITYNTLRTADLQNKLEQQAEINNNAYAFQQGLDQKQFGTLMYGSGNITEGERIIVKSAEIMAPATTYLTSALANDPALLSKFNEVVSIDSSQINGAITNVYTIYQGNGTDTEKYVQIWDQLSVIMDSVTTADAKLEDVRAVTLSNVQNTTVESQNYANFSVITAVAFLGAITAVSVALSIVLGKRITDPLKKLSDIARKVSLGDLNQRYYLKENIDIKTGDEIDELVDAFRRMINAFRITEALNKEDEETTK